VRSKKGVAWEK